MEANRAELEALGTTIIAVCVENAEQAGGMISSSPWPTAPPKEDGELIGAWWSEGRGGYIQPAEFLLGRGGVVLGAMYASGSVGRMGADEAVA